MGYKTIKGYDRFTISRKGIVKRKLDGYIKAIYITSNGYSRVSLNNKDGRGCIKQYVHILVAEAFIPNPLNLPEVNHKDGNKQNCNDWNLEWKTHIGNLDHACKTGLRPGKIMTYSERAIVMLLFNKGVSMTLIGKKIGVSHRTIGRFINGRPKKRKNKQASL